MRRFDKKNNIRVKNLMLEYEYLETKGVLTESKQSEAQALNILTSANTPKAEIVLDTLKTIDKSKNQKNLPAMAVMMLSGEKNSKNIEDVFNDYNELEVKQRIKPIQVSKNSIKLGDETFTDFIKFSEYVHGVKNKYATKEKPSGEGQKVETEGDDKPIFEGNGISIFEGSDVGKCIKFTQGGLTGKSYQFCIGQPDPSRNMYKSYRDSKASTFYYIVDTNRDSNDPLHIVVLDVTKYGIELTDENNTTPKIAEYGTDVDGYLSYLKSKGVPVEKFKNRPKDKKEEDEDRLLGNENPSLEWFIKLPYEMKSAYIGRGHRLSDEQFDYLIGNE